ERCNLFTCSGPVAEGCEGFRVQYVQDRSRAQDGDTRADAGGGGYAAVSVRQENPVMPWVLEMTEQYRAPASPAAASSQERQPLGRPAEAGARRRRAAGMLRRNVLRR